jgi:peroxiredoxin
MRRLLRTLVLPAALLSAAPMLTAPIAAQPAPTLGPADGKELAPTDIERVAVGQPAPDFALARYGGGTLRLSQYRGQKNVVLVFYRGHWCPYCITQLKELRTLLDGELRTDAELLVVSIDGDAETRMAVARIGSDGVQPDFTFLSDPDHAVIDRYGVLNPSGSRRGIPHPAAYVIDKQGIVRWRDVQTDYKVRPTNAAILTALKQLNR